MNAMHELPAARQPTLPADAAGRLVKFKTTLMDAVHEIDAIEARARQGTTPAEVLTAIADLLGDVIAYCPTEALKHGLPPEAVLGIVTDSHESKPGADGGPVCDGNGKLPKGPGGWKPEPRIRVLLEQQGA